MNILILGSGGREHALALRCTEDVTAEKVYVWPGNDGMGSEKIELISLAWSKENFLSEIRSKNVDFVIPGAEKFLYDGVGDWCEEIGLPCFGPTKNAALLEESKLYSKTIMVKAGAPTAAFEDLTSVFLEDSLKTLPVLKRFKKPVIKLSGPALGKGVFVCSHATEAMNVINELKAHPIAGIEAGIFVEEGLSGKEVSMFFACNGTDYSYLGSAQDHKRLLDNDEGPNTGGMGTISPVPWVNEKFISLVTNKFLLPTLIHMKETGNPYKGVLFLGLMVDGSEVNLLEYNVRFGDPETQVLLPLIEGNFSETLYKFTCGDNVIFGHRCETAVHVVKAALGYPGLFGKEVEKGKPIDSQPLPQNATLYFAGVKKEEGTLITNGGRVLGITARGKDKDSARKLVYESLKHVTFPGEQFRRDIGEKL